MEESGNWFENWFNTPYYHILYKNRDFKEAESFIDGLFDLLQPKPGTKTLDLACGRGRHSIYLNKKGLDVVGVDLAESNIEYANQFESPGLHFEVHDMRKPWKSKFDIIFNLFTSFGYFDTQEEDFKVLASIAKSLNKDGFFILDYINIFYALDNMVRYDEKTIDNIDFQIKKTFESNKIIKTISFFAKGKDHTFQERLNCYTKETLEDEFFKLGLQVENIFGDYSLAPFEENHSERLIFVVKKK